MDVSGFSLLTAPNAEPITFTVRDDDPTAEYNVTDITGLDAEEIIRKFSGYGQQRHLKFHEFQLPERQIAMSISLEPRFNIDESYSDVRDKLYRAIFSSRTGEVFFRLEFGGTVAAQLVGYISRFEADLFVQEPKVNMTITCPDPVLRSVQPVVLEPSELPTENLLQITDGRSTAPHGFQTQLTFTEDVPSLTFTDSSDEEAAQWQFKIVPDGGFLEGDVLHFSSGFTDTKLHIDRGGTTIYLIDSVEPGSHWPLLFHGRNEFYIVEAGEDPYPFTWGNLEYYTTYWGV